MKKSSKFEKFDMICQNQNQNQKHMLTQSLGIKESLLLESKGSELAKELSMLNSKLNALEDKV